MKGMLIVLSMFVASSFAMADEGSSNVYDLMYFPQQGTVTGETQLGYTTSSFTYGLITNTFADVSSHELGVEQNFLYAIGPKTLIGVSESYQIDTELQTDYKAGSTLNGTTTKTKSSPGFSEPTFFVKERIGSQDNWGINLDLQVGFSPKLSDAKTATTTAKGNGLRGSSLLDAKLGLGKKHDGKEWSLSLEYLGYGKKRAQSASNTNDITETDSFNILDVVYSYQWVLHPKLELAVNAGVAFIGSQTVVDAFQQTKNAIDSNTVFTAGPALTVNLSQKAILQFGAQFVLAEDSSLNQTDTSKGTSTALMIKDNMSANLTISARYEF